MTRAALAVEPAVPLDCPTCGPVDATLMWRTFVNATIHIEATCPHCYRWLQFVRQTPDVLDLLPPPPTGPEQGALW